MQAALAALLAKREHARAEAQAILIERGAPAELAAAVVQAFAEQGYLDDSRFAERYVSYSTHRGHGPLRIARDLRERGVAAEQIDAALKCGPDWKVVCEDLRRRRFGAAKPGTWAEKGRQARFLQYRGFSSDHMRLSIDADEILDHE